MYLSTKGVTKMIKADELLKTEHTRQLTWLDNQIKKGENSIFLNPKRANTAYKKLQKESLIIDDLDVEKFIGRYLSETGKKKLITTLRVALNRTKSQERLQINLTPKNGAILDYLKHETKLTKQEIINKLIENADLSIFKNKEEQLEITL